MYGNSKMDTKTCRLPYFEKFFLETAGIKSLDVLQKLLDALSDGVYITDGKGKTMMVNQAYERLSGTSRNLFLGKYMEQIVAEGLIDQSGSCMVLATKQEAVINQVLNNKNEVIVTSKPIFDDDGNIEIIVTTVKDVTELNELKVKLDESKRDISKLKYLIDEESNVVYNSHEMRMLLKRAKKLASYDTNILLIGETGVGKDVIAKYIYEVGSRKDKPFVIVNCSAIPANLMESELFGYEPGAFTGALKKGKKGIFELANHGTIFLDEIGELPLELQAKLLTVLQNKKIRKVGGETDIPIDVRIISATNRNLEQMIEDKLFRRDLYYRINVVPIYIPPLRERREDIIALANYFLQQDNMINKTHKYFSEEALKVLYNNDWIGNVRELKNIVQRACIFSNTDCIQQSELSQEIFVTTEYSLEKEKSIEVSMEGVVADVPQSEERVSVPAGMSLNDMLDLYETQVILEALHKTSSHKEAAKVLKVNESTLSRRLKKLNISES